MPCPLLSHDRYNLTLPTFALVRTHVRLYTRAQTLGGCTWADWVPPAIIDIEETVRGNFLLGCAVEELTVLFTNPLLQL